jgi:hypothetical protein
VAAFFFFRGFFAKLGPTDKPRFFKLDSTMDVRVANTYLADCKRLGIPPRFRQIESRVGVPPRQGRGKTAAAARASLFGVAPVTPKVACCLGAVAIKMNAALDQDGILKFSSAMAHFCCLRSFSTGSSGTGSTGFRVRCQERKQRRRATGSENKGRSEMTLDP